MKRIIFLLLLSSMFYLCLAEETVIDSTRTEPAITFLELGSVTCIPCQQMKKVLDSVREKYGDQIEVIFYDIKKEQDIAKKYQVRMMPTQVFLNIEGIEIHRHIGFYPEAQIDEFLQKQGLVILTTEQ